MLRREKPDKPRSETWRMLWTRFDKAKLWVNPFLGAVARSEGEVELYLPEQLRPSSRVPEVKGGLLAEQMGLGKTVEVLALVATNPRSASEVTETPSIATYEPSQALRRAPPPIYDHSPCICGALRERSALATPRSARNPMVQCHGCGLFHHAKCVGFEGADAAEAAGHYCSPLTQCFTCVAFKCFEEPICSRATLIVTPPSLTDQWISEIEKHTTGLKVCFYTGVKDISKTPGKVRCSESQLSLLRF